MAFNQSQKKAITHKKGPAIILAGPGSGKTTVITEHIKFLLEEQLTNEDNILVVTFTKNSAKEMKERFNILTNNRFPKVTFGTFHNAFFQIARDKFDYTQGNLIDEKTQRQVIQSIVKELKIETTNLLDYVEKAKTEISLVKNELKDIATYNAKNIETNTFKVIYNKYIEIMNNNHYIDYDDMLVLCYQAITQDENILKKWQEKYKYILVDEFQDTNQLQFEILKLIALPENNLFVVGDDDQSIYAFRGAKPEIMLNFGKYYPKHKKINLDINYRSTQPIVDAANIVIKKNTTRYDKKLVAKKKTGEQVYLKYQSNPRLEAEDIVKYIQENVSLGIPMNEIAIIYRTNMQARTFTDVLSQNNIKFFVKDGITNIYESIYAKDIFAYIQIGMGKDERIHLPKIINRPCRYVKNEYLKPISLFTMDNVITTFENNPYVPDYVMSSMYSLQSHIATLKEKKTPFELINYICYDMGYIEALKNEYETKKGFDLDEALAIIEELILSSKKYENCEDWFTNIAEYTEEINNIRNNNKREPDTINLLTMHAAKGLEYEVVFIVDANETITPSVQAKTKEEIEEERRMFYVAMTRAKTRLYIYSIRSKGGKELEMSRFVKELKNGLKQKETEDEKNKVLEEMRRTQETFNKLTKEEKLEIVETMVYETIKPLKEKPQIENINTEKEVYHCTFEHGFIQEETNDKYKVFFIKKNKTIVLDKEFCKTYNTLHIF